MGPVPAADVARGFREPIEAAGRTIDEHALEIMTEGCRGYPFLLQLVGALVHEPALSALSDIDRNFLLAMADDDGPSRMADIQQRLGVDVNYASQYRLRLIAAEVIEPIRRGYVDFALPYLRDYLRQLSAPWAASPLVCLVSRVRGRSKCLLCKQEVTGSIPVGSITKLLVTTTSCLAGLRAVSPRSQIGHQLWSSIVAAEADGPWCVIARVHCQVGAIERQRLTRRR